jgi:hypothetical protein
MASSKAAARIGFHPGLGRTMTFMGIMVAKLTRAQTVVFFHWSGT